MGVISAGGITEEPGITPSQLQKLTLHYSIQVIYTSDVRVAGYLQTASEFQDESGKKVSETDEKDRKCENSRRHEPCCTKPDKRAGADGRRQPQRRIRSERGASDITTSARCSSHGICYERIFSSAFETGGSAQLCSGCVMNMKQCVKAEQTSAGIRSPGAGDPPGRADPASRPLADSVRL